MSDPHLHCAIRELIRAHAEEHGGPGAGEARYSPADIAVAVGLVLGGEMAGVPLAVRPVLVAAFVAALNTALELASVPPGEGRH